MTEQEELEAIVLEILQGEGWGYTPEMALSVMRWWQENWDNSHDGLAEFATARIIRDLRKRVAELEDEVGALRYDLMMERGIEGTDI